MMADKEYKFLAAMVLRQALDDLKHAVKNRNFKDKRKITRAIKDGKEARKWLLEDESDIEFWCDAAGVQVKTIREKAKAIINNGG